MVALAPERAGAVVAGVVAVVAIVAAVTVVAWLYFRGHASITDCVRAVARSITAVARAFAAVARAEAAVARAEAAVARAEAAYKNVFLEAMWLVAEASPDKSPPRCAPRDVNTSAEEFLRAFPAAGEDVVSAWAAFRTQHAARWQPPSDAGLIEACDVHSSIARVLEAVVPRDQLRVWHRGSVTEHDFTITGMRMRRPRPLAHSSA